MAHTIPQRRGKSKAARPHTEKTAAPWRAAVSAAGGELPSCGRLPSIDKGKPACQRVFPALFALFALAGASPPASQKPKITRRSIAGRCGQFCRSRNVSRRGKARREYCRIVKGLDAVWAHFCPSKPCLPSSIDGKRKNKSGKEKGEVLLIGGLADDAYHHEKSGQSGQQNIQSHASAPPFLSVSLTCF